MKKHCCAFLCLSALAVASLACSVSGLTATPTPDVRTAVALAHTQAALAATQTALAQPTSPPQPTLLPPATDTPAPPQAQTGTIRGKLCYPSEGIPPLTVYAREVNTLATVSISTAENQGEYTIEVPAPGTYIVFAWTDFGVGGTYSPAVPCGLAVGCDDHSPTHLEVASGGAVTGADICDYYGPEGSVPPPG